MPSVKRIIQQLVVNNWDIKTLTCDLVQGQSMDTKAQEQGTSKRGQVLPDKEPTSIQRLYSTTFSIISLCVHKSQDPNYREELLLQPTSVRYRRQTRVRDLLPPMLFKLTMKALFDT